MKLIESGPPLPAGLGYRIAHLFVGNDLPVMDSNVAYLSEIRAELLEDKKAILFHHTIIGKKSDYICGDCGVNFISHKGMCSSCYVRQL